MGLMMPLLDQACSALPTNGWLYGAWSGLGEREPGGSGRQDRWGQRLTWGCLTCYSKGWWPRDQVGNFYLAASSDFCHPQNRVPKSSCSSRKLPLIAPKQTEEHVGHMFGIEGAGLLHPAPPPFGPHDLAVNSSCCLGDSEWTKTTPRAESLCEM